MVTKIYNSDPRASTVAVQLLNMGQWAVLDPYYNPMQRAIRTNSSLLVVDGHGGIWFFHALWTIVVNAMVLRYRE